MLLIMSFFGFRAVPFLIIYDTQDRFCGANSAAVPHAHADGFHNNRRWATAPNQKTIERQKNSPLGLVLLKTETGPSRGDEEDVRPAVDHFVSQAKSRFARDLF